MKIESLPIEILLDIFERLDYWDLKLAVPATCRRFQHVINTSSGHGRIDRILYRDVPPNKNNEPSSLNLDEIEGPFPNYTGRITKTLAFFPRFNPPEIAPEDFEGEMHPCFDLLSYDLLPFVSNVCVGYVPLPSTSIASENATSPPVREVILHVASYPALRITNPRGVTVLQIMQGVVQAYSTPIAEDNEEDAAYYPPGTTRAMMIHTWSRYEWEGTPWVAVVGGEVHMYEANSGGRATPNDWDNDEYYPYGSEEMELDPMRHPW